VIRGAVASNLGAAVHGAELRVHFLKSFQEGHICEILSQKGPKNKKVTGGGGVNMSHFFFLHLKDFVTLMPTFFSPVSTLSVQWGKMN
jgi:hypothetical protein